MARKKSPRTLPALPKLRVSDVREHKTELILQTLRHLAAGAQEEQARTFYSMREVASQFRAPLSMVAGIYRRLEREGILRSVRGSKTVLRGRKHDRQLSVRGLVGLPRTTSKYVTVQDYRMFLKWLRRELRLSGFAAQTVDVERHAAHDFAQRIKKYEIDTIIWFQPGTLAKQALLHLNDLGLRVVGVSDGSHPSIPCDYEIHREVAVRNILRNWHAGASVIKSVTIISSRGPTVMDEERLAEIVEEEGLAFELLHVTSKSISSVLESLSQKENIGIAFLSSAAPMFAFRAPELVTKLFERCRVALIEGPVNMPFAKVPEVRVDLVLVDWQLVAQRIVGDLIIDNPLDSRKSVIFEAESRLRVPLSQYAESI